MSVDLPMIYSPHAICMIKCGLLLQVLMGDSVLKSKFINQSNGIYKMSYLKKVQAQLLNIPKIKWEYPTDKELLNEVKSEYWIETLFITEHWPKQHDYEQAIQDLKEVSKPQELNPKKIKGKHIWKSYEDLHKTVKSFGLPKDPDAMLKAIKDGKPLPMPIVVKHLNGEMELLGGATRSGIANLANQSITALLIDEKKANKNMADRMEDKVEKEAQEEKQRSIYKQVRDYYLNNKEKPSFTDIHDQFTAHIAEFQYRKIAKLRGHPERDWMYSNTELKEKKKTIQSKVHPDYLSFKDAMHLHRMQWFKGKHKEWGDTEDDYFFPYGEQYKQERFVKVEIPAKDIETVAHNRKRIDQYKEILKKQGEKSMGELWVSAGRKMKDGSIQRYADRLTFSALDGNHRLKAAQELGHTKQNVIMPESHWKAYQDGNILIIADTFRSKLKTKYHIVAISTVTIPANSYLFHGTSEKFSGKLRGGGYDKIIWFSDSPKIAQLYIPIAGMTMYLSAENISKPNKNKNSQELQKQLGIEYDYSEVEWDGQRAKSYYNPKGWKKLPTEDDVEHLMKQKGFGTRKHSSDSFIVRFSNNKILKEGEAEKGRLFIARVKEPLTLWRKAKGDSDLQDLQYHDLSGFQKAKGKGLDGVLIDDFAQSKEYGNFGHLSVGLSSTDKLAVKEIPAQYREWTYKEKGTPEYPNPPEMYLHTL